MGTSAEKILIKLDDGSARVLSGIVEVEVGCHKAVGLQAEEGLFPMFRHALFCKTFMSRSEVGDPIGNDQCVVMGEEGEVHECPIFGTNQNGEPLGQHEKLVKLAELNRKISASLTYSKHGNYSTIYGSELDPSTG